MRKILRYCGLLIIIPAVLVICFYFNSPANAKGNDINIYTNVEEVSYTDATSISIYNDIYNAMVNLEDKVDLSKYKKESKEVFDIVNTVIYDKPEIFYYNGCSYWSSGMLDIKYLYSKSSITAMKKQLEDAVNNVICANITPGMTEFEKEKALHDYIVLNTAYDEENFAKDTVPEESYNPYGILVRHIGVCEGYAETMKLILNRLGIECIVISSDSMNHGWNLVKIDGEWYQLDATWDDPVPDVQGRVRYKYFNISDAKMSEDHEWDTSKYTKCTSEKYAYFSDMQYPAKDGDLFYYSSESNNDILYKIKIDGTGKAKVCNDRALYICSYGDWLYYSNYSYAGYIFKIKKDGTGRSQVNKIYSTNLYIKDGKLYFKDENAGKLYYMDIEDVYIDTTAPSVTTSMSEGVYKNTVQLNLTLSEDGTIYYTTDGSLPAINGVKYTCAIVIDKSMILKYIAVDNLGNISNVYSAAYVIDNSFSKLFNMFTDQPGNKQWTVKFNANIDPSTVNANTVRIYDLSLNKYVDAIINTGVDGKSVTVSPKETLSSGKIYCVIIDTGMKSLDGNNLTKTVKAYFTVK